MNIFISFTKVVYKKILRSYFYAAATERFILVYTCLHFTITRVQIFSSTSLHVQIILVGKCHPFGLSNSSPFPLGKGRVFIFTTMRRCSLKLVRPLPGQQSAQSDTPTVWVTPGPAAQCSTVPHSPKRQG